MTTYRGSLTKLLSESSSTPGEIQILKTGTFTSDLYGEFRVTDSDLRAMKKNFDDKVRGVDCAIDYEHNNLSLAAGWIKGLVLKNEDTELWAFVEWTPNGEIKVREREFRYTSAEFDYNYKSNETKDEYGPTLLGAALTNRPFVKEMQPIILTEVTNRNEDTTVVAATTANQEITTDSKETEMSVEEIKTLKDKVESLTASLAEKDAKIAEFEAEATKLAEAKKLSEKKAKFDVMLSEGKACEAQREGFMSDNFEEFTSKAQPVKLSEKGTSEEVKAEVTGTAQEQILALAKVKLSEKKAKDMDKAIKLVLSENKELSQKYYEETKI